ncbi:MAG: MFS transporter [Candidatus Lokiarchaeota archaeon]|nr:MFS transporter [Candidatus Lokiarchaeota archaeon]
MSFKIETKVTPPFISQRSNKYVAFIVIFMGLIALLDQYLNLVETAIIDDIILEYFLVNDQTTQGFFQLWQGIYGIIGFFVFFISWLSDAYGRRKGLLVLILVMGIPAVLIPFTPAGPMGFHFFMILYGIVIMGTLSNVWEIPVTEESPPKKRGLYGSLAFLIGLIPIYAIIAPRIASIFSWKWAYGIMGILMVVCLILLYFMKEPERWECCKEERKHAAYEFIKQLKTLERKDIILLALFSAVYVIWNMAFKMGGTGGKQLFVFIGQKAQFDGYILTIAGLMTMAGAVISGVLMDKIGRNGTLVFGAIGSVISFMMLPFTASTTPLFFWTVYFFMPIVLAWIMVYFSEMFPTKNRATCTGILSSVSRLGYVFGPILGGFLISTFNFHVYFIVGGFLMMLPMLVLFTKPLEAKAKTLEEIEAER